MLTTTPLWVANTRLKLQSHPKNKDTPNLYSGTIGTMINCMLHAPSDSFLTLLMSFRLHAEDHAGGGVGRSVERDEPLTLARHKSCNPLHGVRSPQALRHEENIEKGCFTAKITINPCKCVFFSGAERVHVFRAGSVG